MSELENKITIKLVSEGMGTLQRNGVDMVCPHVPPMTMRERIPSSIVSGGAPQERVTISRSPCNTNCPLFQINGAMRGENSSVTLSCGGQNVDYTVKEIIPIPTPVNQQPSATLAQNESTTGTAPMPDGKGVVINFTSTSTK